MREHVILVNDNDQEVGIGEKMQTHRDGKLHRAFSIFVFDSDGRLLLQKRSATKYHSANLWSNTCCGHPQPSELTLDAAHRRLQQELGLDCELHEKFVFRYRAEFTNQLIENEYDHVFVGECSTEPLPNACEVQDWRWISLGELMKRLQVQPAQYTYWPRHRQMAALNNGLSQTNLSKTVLRQLLDRRLFSMDFIMTGINSV